MISEPDMVNVNSAPSAIDEDGELTADTEGETYEADE